jgi:ABC-type sugar transport system substrate-binding protein
MALCCCLISAQASAAKKVLIVHSYHAEYDWCQGVNEGIEKILKLAGVETRIFYMDTKRNSIQEWKEKSGQAAEAEMNAYDPDVVITVDDDAQAFFAKKHVNDDKRQIVFCGVNAEPEKYGFPAKNVTASWNALMPITQWDCSTKLSLALKGWP